MTEILTLNVEHSRPLCFQRLVARGEQPQNL